ncbi:MAG: riboflavin synthase [bacterium]|nr:riboflavin synthase [bacterium]
MFTGIVEARVPVLSFEPRGTGARLVLPAPDRPDWRAEIGQSIAICGTCLTVVEVEPDGAMGFDLSAETLARTWLGALAPGTQVNLERAMQLGDRLDGHMVAGHVDGTGAVVGIEDSGDGGRLIRFEVDTGLERYLVDKGSVTLDGISLTVVEPVGRSFGVAVIPLTLELTNLGAAEVGKRVNVEADLVGKWIERLMV